ASLYQMRAGAARLGRAPIHAPLPMLGRGISLGLASLPTTNGGLCRVQPCCSNRKSGQYVASLGKARTHQRRNDLWTSRIAAARGPAGRSPVPAPCRACYMAARFLVGTARLDSTWHEYTNKRYAIIGPN